VALEQQAFEFVDSIDDGTQFFVMWFEIVLHQI
jgi:hypothetical protein